MIRLVFKRNDQETAPGKELLGMRHGMLVDYHVEGEYWPTLSKRMQEAFLCVEVEDTKANRDYVRDAVKSVEVTLPNGKPDLVNSRARAMRVDVAALGAKLLDTKLDATLRTATEVAPVKADKLKLSDVLVSTATLAAASEDVRAVSSGSYTVGSGGDYASFPAAFADIANLTGNLTFTQIGNVTDTAIATTTETLGGFLLRVTSNTDPGGTTTANKLTINHADHHLDFACEGAGSVEVDHLYAEKAASASSDYPGVVCIRNVDAGYTINVHKNVFDLQNKRGSGIFQNESDVTSYFYNNEIYGSGGWIGTQTGIYCFRMKTAYNIQNNTIWQTTTGINANGQNGTISNCAAYDCTTDFANISAATGYNNSDTDGTAANANWATGSGNRTGTSAVDFVSTDDTASTFLDIAPAGGLVNVGYSTLLAENTACIRGRIRPNGRGMVSIGASEVLLSGVSRGQLFGQVHGQLHGQG